MGMHVEFTALSNKVKITLILIFVFWVFFYPAALLLIIKTSKQHSGDHAVNGDWTARLVLNVEVGSKIPAYAA